MAVSNPEQDGLVDGRYAIQDLVDLDQLRCLFDEFAEATGFTIGFLDHPGMNLLITSGWQDICTEFHRKCPASNAICIKSNRQLLTRLDTPGKIVVELCDNGLVDCATPIIIQGKHIASLVTGQLLLKTPDIESFKQQAHRYGFDETEYLKALNDVPVVEDERVKKVTRFLGRMAGIISQLGFARLLEIEDSERMSIEIAERKRVEEALRESEARYRINFENVSDVIYSIDREFRVLDVSPSVERVLGYKPDEMIGKRFQELGVLAPASLERAFSEAMRVFQGERIDSAIYQFIARDGTEKWGEVSGAPLVQDGQIVAAVSVARDITERRQAEEALRESEKKFKATFDFAADAMHLMDGERFIANNRMALQMYGYETEEMMQHASPMDISPERQPDGQLSREKAMKYINGALAGCPQRFYWKHKRRDTGELFDVEVSLCRIVLAGRTYLLASGRDITERMRAEAEKMAMEGQLRQAQKLESIGTLASGVAHEINNPLMGIQGYAELIADRVADESLTKFAKGIVEETSRMGKIVRNLLAFSRQDESSHSPARIKDIIEAAVSLVGAVLRHDQITLELNIPDDLPKIKCRSQRIQQVVLNLLTNARHALNERYPEYHEDKKVRVMVDAFEKDGRQWIRTSVEDHGTGIAQELMDRIFDPFFTTKGRTEGTGLGLSVSYGIVKEHHGNLWAESEQGVFARFHMELPVDNSWSLNDRRSNEMDEHLVEEKVG